MPDESARTGFLGALEADARILVRGVVAVLMLPLVILAVVRARFETVRRRKSGALPRLIWGPVPIISIKYWSEALQERGFESRTCVFGYYSINERADFDVHYDEFLPDGLFFEVFRPYAVFLWVLRTADVYLCYFDGGFMQMTALRPIELPLLRLAGIQIIVSPYGSDIAVCGYLGVAEHPLLHDYPEIATRSPQVQARVDHFTQWANLIVRNYQYGYLPHWDVLWPTQLAIDTERWCSAEPLSEADGHTGEVVVVHAPNHRHIKGTDCLISAIGRLREDGLRVRLELLERRPNEEVRSAVLRADIIAEQFVAGYALFAIEGMAAGKPVLSALSWMPSDVRKALDARGLPIVDVECENLKEILCELIEDPHRRHTLGASSRNFVVEYHSYEAVGAVWEAIIRHVWRADPLPVILVQPDNC